MKKSVLSLFCSFILVTQIACAIDKPDAVAQVNAQINALSDAMVKADSAMLKKLTSPALSYGHSSGRVENQAEFIANIVNGNSNFLNIELIDPGITVSGNVAIARHILAANTLDAGKEPAAIRIGIMLIWHLENGEWLLLARQAYKLPN